MSAAAIIQARAGSTRLPGKMLEVVQDRSVLGHVIARARAVAGISRVVVATSLLERDDRVAGEAARHDAEVFRGDETDVLGRYHACARGLGAETIVRICGDCVVLDPDEAARLLAAHGAGADCTHNKHDRGVVSGAGAEAIAMTALERAYREATSAYDREHVTPYIRGGRDRFTVLEVDAGRERQAPELDVSLDTIEDLAALREIARRLTVPLATAPIAEIIRVARTHGLLRKPALEGAQA